MNTDIASPSSAPVPFRPQDAKPTHDWPHSARLLCCRIDPAGKYVFAGGTDNTI